ncbi:MAG: type IV secretion system protein [Rickettsiales bacterium]|nr:type IV secretion system protein [Rickettsiales bacterium]
MTWLLALLAISTILFAVVTEVNAKPKQKEPGPLNTHKSGAMDSKENCRDKHEGKLIAVIVPCIRDTIQEATETMTDQFDEHLKSATWAFATLVMTIFGIKMLMNEGDLKKEGIMLLLKIGGVALFIDNFGGYIPDMFAAVQEGSEIVTSALGGALAGAECDTSQYKGEKPWNYLDCVLGEMFGFAPGIFVGSSLIALMGAPFSGEFGPMLTMGGVTAIFFILKLVIRSVYTYLMALMTMGFLIVISPLLIPLLFMGVTFQYFEHWLRAIMSTMLIPLVVLAYCTLAFAILDKMFYDDDFGIAKILPSKDIPKYTNSMGEGVTSSAMNDPLRTAQKAQGISPSDWVKTRQFQHQALPWAGGNIGTDFVSSLSSYDFRDKNVSKSQKLFFGFVALVLMAYLLDTMLEAVIGIAQQMLGGGFALGSAVKNNPIEGGLEKLKEKATKDLPGAMDQIKGFARKGLG